MRASSFFKIFFAALVIVALSWLASSYIITFLSGRLIYRTEFSHRMSVSIPFEQFYVQNSKGDNIDFMWIPKGGDVWKEHPTYIYLHTNAGRLPHIVEQLARAGNVLAPAYPGFASSEGRSSTDAINEVVDLSMTYLKERGMLEKDIVVFGNSLGGAPALYAGAKYPDICGVILVNTFYSIRRMCEKYFNVLCLFTEDIHNSAALAPQVRVPVRQFHNKDDPLIPYSQGKALHALFGSEDVEFFDISGGHVTFPVDEILRKANLDCQW